MAYQPINLGTGNNTGDAEGIRDGGVKIDSNFKELYASKAPDEFVFVSVPSDLPTPVSGVITLLANYTYYFTKNIDLTGDRLVGSENTVILGTSSENVAITSTGLGVGIALFTTVWTTPIRNITFKGVDTAFDIDGTGNNVALDWGATNIEDVPNIGVIKNFENWIFTKSAILNSKGLIFDGSINVIAGDNNIFVGDGLAGDIIKIASTATIDIRFRIVYSSIVAFGSTVGINVDVAATIPDESYILDTVNFSGGGTYIAGIDYTDNKSLFVKNNGIINTFVNGQLYMQNNATVTTISTISTFTKILGTTTPSVDNSRYLHSNNRLTCNASLDRKYLIQCNLSFESGNNQNCEFGFYDSKLAAVRTPSRTKSTSSGTGKSENVSFNCVVDFIQGNYLEVMCANNTSTADITVTDMNFIITEIG